MAVLYGAIATGAKSMGVVSGIPLALLTVIVAFAILFEAAPELTRSIWRQGATATRRGWREPARRPGGVDLTKPVNLRERSVPTAPR